MTPTKKAVLILSGGMDSTTLLYDLISQQYDVHAITYWQPASPQLGTEPGGGGSGNRQR